MPFCYVLRGWGVSARKRTLGVVGVRWRLRVTLGVLVGAPLVLFCCCLCGFLVGTPLVFGEVGLLVMFSSTLLAYARGPPAEAVKKDYWAVPVAE